MVFLVDINSNFIEISIILFPSPSAPSSVLALLPIYIDSFFSLPVTRADGTQLSFEDVVTKLDEETLSYSIDIGSPLQEGLTLKIKVAKEKYKEAVAWLRDLLLGSTFSVDRFVFFLLSSAGSGLIQGECGTGLESPLGKLYRTFPRKREVVPESLMPLIVILFEERKGSFSLLPFTLLLFFGMDRDNFVVDSTNIAMNLLNRVDFLPAFIERLKEEPDAVVADFEAFRTGCECSVRSFLEQVADVLCVVVNPRSMRVSVKGDILSLHYPSQTWAENFEKFPTFDVSLLSSISSCPY